MSIRVGWLDERPKGGEENVPSGEGGSELLVIQRSCRNWLCFLVEYLQGVGIVEGRVAAQRSGGLGLLTGRQDHASFTQCSLGAAPFPLVRNTVCHSCPFPLSPRSWWRIAGGFTTVRGRAGTVCDFLRFQCGHRGQGS